MNFKYLEIFLHKIYERNNASPFCQRFKLIAWTAWTVLLVERCADFSSSDRCSTLTTNQSKKQSSISDRVTLATHCGCYSLFKV